METKRKMASAVLTAILASMMAFSAYAAYGSASASSSAASASVSSAVAGNIDVYATIGNSSGWVRDEYDEDNSTYGSAAVSASSLNPEGGSAQSARARGWFDDKSVCEDYWSVLGK